MYLIILIKAYWRAFHSLQGQMGLHSLQGQMWLHLSPGKREVLSKNLQTYPAKVSIIIHRMSVVMFFFLQCSFSEIHVTTIILLLLEFPSYVFIFLTFSCFVPLCFTWIFWKELLLILLSYSSLTVFLWIEVVSSFTLSYILRVILYCLFVPLFPFFPLPPFFLYMCVCVFFIVMTTRCIIMIEAMVYFVTELNALD